MDRPFLGRGQRSTGLTWLVVLLLLAGIGRAEADRLFLKDGSEVVGTIGRWAEGEVRLTETFAGEVAFKASKVQGVTTESNRVVALESGDEIVGRLVYEEEKGQGLNSKTFGSVEVEPRQIRAVWDPDETEPTVIQTEQAYEKKLDEAQQEQEKKLMSMKEAHQAETKELEAQIEKRADPWSGQLDFGLNGQSGNSDRLGFRGRGEVRRETDFDRLLVYLQGEFARQEGVRSENEILGGTKLEVDVSERFYTLGKVQMEFDEFENLDLRTRITAGMGYFIYERENEHFKVFASPGYQHESFMDGTTVDQGILELGWNFREEFTPWLLFTQDTTFIPSLEDPSDFRVVADSAGEIPITGDKRWKIRLGIRNEYDNQPRPGVKELDTTYYANLTLSFQ